MRLCSVAFEKSLSKPFCGKTGWFAVVLVLCVMLPGCATKMVRLSVEGLLEETGIGGAASTAVNKREFKTQVIIPLGSPLIISGVHGSAFTVQRKDPSAPTSGAGTGESPMERTVVRITPESISSGQAFLELEVMRVVDGKEVLLARPRVKVNLGERVVAESRASGDDSGLRYFKFALLPQLLD